MPSHMLLALAHTIHHMCPWPLRPPLPLRPYTCLHHSQEPWDHHMCKPVYMREWSVADGRVRCVVAGLDHVSRSTRSIDLRRCEGPHLEATGQHDGRVDGRVHAKTEDKGHPAT